MSVMNMNIDITPPDAEVLACFNSLDATLTADASGEKSVRIARFLGNAEMETRQWLLRTTDFEARRVAQCMADAFGASRRVVMTAWNKKHGRELAV